MDCESDPLRLRPRLTTAIFAVWRRCIAGALLALTACASPPPPPPPPLVTLAPAEGVVLTVDVFRVPEGVAWSEVESDCANGVWRPGDIEMVDRRQEPGSADQPCFRVQWTNGLKLRWEGCDQLAYPDQPRYRRFRILGVFAARAIVGRGAWHSGGAARVLGEVGWYTEACTLAERALRWSRAKPGGEIPQEILAGVMSGLPPDWQAKFHERMVVETINAVRQAQEDGDGFLQHRATYALVALGQHVPTGSSAAAFVRRVRDSGVLDVENLTKVLRHLRAALVAERAYVDALEGDPDPVGEYLDLASMSDLVTGAAGLFPSALIPAPSTATAAEKWGIKEGARLMMYEMQRKEGLLLYEALVGAGRVADAERMKRELKSRYPVPPIPQGDSEEDVVLRRLLKDLLPPGDLDFRLREAEGRAGR